MNEMNDNEAVTYTVITIIIGLLIAVWMITRCSVENTRLITQWERSEGEEIVSNAPGSWVIRKTK